MTSGKSEEGGKTARGSGIWTRKEKILLFIVTIIVTIIITLMTILIITNLLSRECGKAFCCREVNRLQAEVRWLKAKQQNLAQSQKKKFYEIDTNQNNYYIVLILLLAINVTGFLLFWLRNKDDNGDSISEEISDIQEWRTHVAKRLGRMRKNESVIAYFTSKWSSDDENLAKSINCQNSRKLIREESDAYDIDAKLVFLFVKCNERHIILEKTSDTSQLRRKTANFMEHTGGKAVVIYMLHGDSGDLKDECLYSKKLTSINYHPILKKLSEEDCMISINKELSRYQEKHLQTLCKKYLSAES